MKRGWDIAFFYYIKIKIKHLDLGKKLRFQGTICVSYNFKAFLDYRSRYRSVYV